MPKGRHLANMMDHEEVQVVSAPNSFAVEGLTAVQMYHTIRNASEINYDQIAKDLGLKNATAA